MAGSARPTLSRQTDDKGIYHGRRYALRFPVLRATRCPKNYLQQNVSIFNFERISGSIVPICAGNFFLYGLV